MDENNDRQGPGIGAGLLAKLGLAVAYATVTAAVGTVSATAPVSLAIAGAVIGLFSFSEALVSWAHSGDATRDGRVPRDRIQRERRAEGFNPKAMHVGVCGPAGVGKTSILNSLRGLHNRTVGAAPTGTTETTLRHASYAAHDNVGALFIHDLPGAGTLRIRAKDYYHDQKLYLYDTLLIVQGERFGEIEIHIIRECIRQGQGFIIVRSRSDMYVRNIADDGDGDMSHAREEHRVSTLAGIRDELTRSKAPDGVLEGLAEHVVLVNKNDLRRLVTLGLDEWPEPGDTEMQERDLLKFLGKAGMGA